MYKILWNILKIYINLEKEKNDCNIIYIIMI